MLTYLKWITVLAAFLSSSLVSFGGVLPNEWRKALVSIEAQVPAQSRIPGTSEFQAVGTGFFVTPDTSPPYRSVMFTAAHVFVELCNAGVDHVYLRIEESPSAPESQVRRYPLTICDRTMEGDNVSYRPRWTQHPSADLAAIVPQSEASIAPTDLLPFPANFIANAEDWKKWSVGEGDDVVGLMFYPNAEPDRPSSAIVRQGIIAEAKEDASSLLVSMTVFPGNSGAPVILRPTVVHYDYNNPGGGMTVGQINPPLILGVVTEYVPYDETAISIQTRRPRVVFEENSGLTRIVRSERISELLAQIVPTLPARN